jgi:1-acyl-sn-glycerol-3-phosphate acyltransferase
MLGADRVPAHREQFGFWTPDRTWMAFKHTFGPPFRLAFRIRAYGTEHVPPVGPVVLATNHMSAWDPILYGAVLDRPIRWMAKTEVFEASPALEKLLSHGGVFTVRRGAGDIAAVRAARDVLREGSLLGMFVEGTRQPTEEVGDVKPGTMMIALAEGAPVVPAVVQGTHRLVREPWHPVTFAFGEQLRFEGRPSVREATARLDSELRRLQRFAQSTIAAGRPRRAQPPVPEGAAW